jgi:hypothetical protein
MATESKFAASTLVATAWLITFHPERLADWLDRHPHGDELERETRELIAKKAARSRKQREDVA